MRRSVLTLVALLALVMLGTPATAETEGPTSCGGSWGPEPAKCLLRYWGGSVGVGLSLSGDPGAAGVVRLMGPSGMLRGVQDEILECAAAGTQWGGGCGATMVSNKALAPIGAYLTCIVEGVADQGAYACSTSGP